MNTAEQELADAIYGAVQHFTNHTARSLQSSAFQVGVSDLGFCSERTRRMLEQQIPDDTDMLPAFIGTAIGDYVEKAIVESLWPDAITQAEVAVTLTGSRGMTFTIGGHPDVILRDKGLVIDVKTAFGLTYVEKDGPDQQKQFQRHLYALAAHQQGMFGDRPLSDIKVANVWFDRGGVDRRAHLQMEPFNMEWVEAATEWIDDVVYAWVHGEEARKEPPRAMCAKACGFFRTCRAFDTDVEGLLTMPEHLAGIEMYLDGAAQEKAGKRLKDEAKVLLKDVQGSTGRHQLRWTWKNTRNGGGYWAIDITEIPQRVVTA
jgi:hypothetical protein